MEREIVEPMTLRQRLDQVPDLKPEIRDRVLALIPGD
jgi:hypothetical protein